MLTGQCYLLSFGLFLGLSSKKKYVDTSISCKIVAKLVKATFFECRANRSTVTDPEAIFESMKTLLVRYNI